MLLLTGVLLTLTWGVLALGSVHPWAYQPLLVASALIGLVSIWEGRNRSRLPLGLVTTVIILLAMIALQLVPLSHAQLLQLTPNAIPIIQARDLTIAMGGLQSHALSIDTRQTVLGAAFLASLSLLMLGTARMLTRDRTQRLVKALVVLGTLVAIIGIVQRATSPGKIYGLYGDWQGTAPFGPFINRNHFAGWMLMVIPASLGYLLALISKGTRGSSKEFRQVALWFSTPEANKAIVTAFAIMIMTLALLLTLSRSGIACLGVAFLIIIAMTLKHQSATSRRLVIAGSLLALVIAVVSWAGIDQIVTRFASVELNSINERPAIWADTLRIVKDFWLTGTGLNTYGVSTLSYQTAMPGFHLREAHNDYLQLAAEGGLMLGVPILAVIGTFILAVRRRFRDDVGSIWWFRMGALTGLVAIALQSIVEFSLQMPGNAALFAVLAGIGLHDGGERRSHPLASARR